MRRGLVCASSDEIVLIIGCIGMHRIIMYSRHFSLIAGRLPKSVDNGYNREDNEENDKNCKPQPTGGSFSLRTHRNPPLEYYVKEYINKLVVSQDRLRSHQQQSIGVVAVDKFFDHQKRESTGPPRGRPSGAVAPTQIPFTHMN